MENNDDNLDGKPSFLNEEWYKNIQRRSAKEAKAVVDAIELLKKTFEIKGVSFGHQGDQFQKNESTLVFELKSRYD